MNEKLNIAEILKDCPKGMELDCTCADNVVFDKIIEYNQIKCVIGECRDPFILDKYGRLLHICCPKCVIFPKGKTTWEGFQRPFKDGDILAYTSSHTTVFIYQNKDNEPKYTTSFYVGYTIGGSYCTFSIYNKHALVALNGNCNTRLATEEEKQKLFDAIKENGYKWNAETKTLEKLIEPKFKVGDRIKHRLTGGVYKVLFVRSDGYGGGVYDVAVTNEIGKIIGIEEQDSYELVPNKFDISTLEPFESKVLVRSSMDGLWKPAVFGFRNGYNDNAFYIVGGSCWKQCIPYLNNEHLCGTTDDCVDYFKTWE